MSVWRTATFVLTALLVSVVVLQSAPMLSDDPSELPQMQTSIAQTDRISLKSAIQSALAKPEGATSCLFMSASWCPNCQESFKAVAPYVKQASVQKTGTLNYLVNLDDYWNREKNQINDGQEDVKAFLDHHKCTATDTVGAWTCAVCSNGRQSKSKHGIFESPEAVKEFVEAKAMETRDLQVVGERIRTFHRVPWHAAKQNLKCDGIVKIFNFAADGCPVCHSSSHAVDRHRKEDSKDNPRLALYVDADSLFEAYKAQDQDAISNNVLTPVLDALGCVGIPGQRGPWTCSVKMECVDPDTWVATTYSGVWDSAAQIRSLFGTSDSEDEAGCTACGSGRPQPRTLTQQEVSILTGH